MKRSFSPWQRRAGRIAILSLGIAACCTKKDCSDIGGFQLQFYNYSGVALDSVVVFTYPRNTGLAIPVDSQKLYVAMDSAKGYAVTQFYTKNFSSDYQIRLRATGQVFNITAIETEKKGCNSCFPYRPDSDYFEVFKACQVNGQRQQERVIRLYK